MKIFQKIASFILIGLVLLMTFFIEIESKTFFESYFIDVFKDVWYIESPFTFWNVVTLIIYCSFYVLFAMSIILLLVVLFKKDAFKLIRFLTFIILISTLTFALYPMSEAIYQHIKLLLYTYSSIIFLSFVLSFLPSNE